MKEDDILRAIKSSIETFADCKFQEKSWMKGIGLEVSSYEDEFCNLFDGLAFEYFLDEEASPDFRKTKSYHKLSQVRESLNHFDDEPYKDQLGFVNPNLLLKSQSWKNVQKVCRDCLDTIKVESG